MNSILTSVIRADPEYGQLLRATKQDFRANPLPILASGLCEGAADALLVSLLEDTEHERGGAALMLCGLLAEGETTLHDPNGQIARGYEDLPGMLRALGAEVEEE